MTLRFLTVLVMANCLIACDPAAGVRASLTLRPVPAPGCIDSALAQSAKLTSLEEDMRYVASDPTDRLFRAHFIDAAQGQSFATLRVQMRGDSVVNLTASFDWWGSLRGYPDSTRAWMATRAKRLVRALQAICAPHSTDLPACEQFQFPTFGRDLSCGGSAT